MADFKTALGLTLQNEGKYANDSNDAGGETYKGIARNENSKWAGWIIIDQYKTKSGFPGTLESDIALQTEVEQFYKINYWDKVLGDTITQQQTANCIFDFAVNAGTGTAAILTQKSISRPEDGILNPDNIQALNQIDQEVFLAYFTICKIARYIGLVNKRRTNEKYFYGWVRRALGET